MDELNLTNLDVQMEIYASNGTGTPTKMYHPVLIDKVQWSGTWDCNPSKMTFTVLKDKVINYGMGSKVVLKLHGKPVWVGYVMAKKRNSDVKIENTAYDQIRYLKNPVVKSFADMSTEKAIKELVGEYSLPIGEIKDIKESKLEDMVVDGQEGIEVVNEILTRHLKSTYENLNFYDKAGVLTVQKLDDMRITNQFFTPMEMSDWEYASGIENTYNSIIIDELEFDGETHMKYTKVEDEESIKRWGLLRFMDKSNEGGDLPKCKAEALLKLLNRENRTLKLKKVRGNSEVYPGSLVAVKLPLGDMNLCSWMVVKEVVHTIDSTGYWMDLTVENSELGFADPVSPEGHFSVEKPEKTDTDSGFVEGDSVPATIYNFLRAKGFSAAAACGILGNMDAESGFNPTAQNVLPGGGSDGGYGLCQWTNTPGSPRRNNLFNWCKSNGKDVNSVTAQLEFLMYEYQLSGYAVNLGDRYKKMTDVVLATADCLKYFEGYPSPYQEVQWSRRKATAEKYWGMWKDYKQVPSSGGGVPSGACPAKLMQAIKTTGWPGPDLCATWTTYVMLKVYGQRLNGNGIDQTRDWCHSANLSAIKPGMLIGCEHSPWSYSFGHIAIYVGNNKVYSSERSGVEIRGLTEFINLYGPNNGGSQVRWGWAFNTPIS